MRILKCLLRCRCQERPQKHGASIINAMLELVLVFIKEPADDRKITHVSQKLLQDVHIKSQIATCQHILKYFAPVTTTPSWN